MNSILDRGLKKVQGGSRSFLKKIREVFCFGLSGGSPLQSRCCEAQK